MYNSDTEMLFPTRVIPCLRDLRGVRWQRLVDEVARREDGHQDTLAFGLMMIRLGGCLTCHADSYRAMRGCTACAQQTIMRFRDSDAALVKVYKEARKDVDAYLKNGNAINV